MTAPSLIDDRELGSSRDEATLVRRVDGPTFQIRKAILDLEALLPYGGLSIIL